MILILESNQKYSITVLQNCTVNPKINFGELFFVCLVVKGYNLLMKKELLTKFIIKIRGMS